MTTVALGQKDRVLNIGPFHGCRSIVNAAASPRFRSCSTQGLALSGAVEEFGGCDSPRSIEPAPAHCPTPTIRVPQAIDQGPLVVFADMSPESVLTFYAHVNVLESDDPER